MGKHKGKRDFLAFYNDYDVFLEICIFFFKVENRNQYKAVYVSLVEQTVLKYKDGSRYSGPLGCSPLGQNCSLHWCPFPCLRTWTRAEARPWHIVGPCLEKQANENKKEEKANFVSMSVCMHTLTGTFSTAVWPEHPDAVTAWGEVAFQLLASLK